MKPPEDSPGSHRPVERPMTAVFQARIEASVLNVVNHVLFPHTVLVHPERLAEATGPRVVLVDHLVQLDAHLTRGSVRNLCPNDHIMTCAEFAVNQLSNRWPLKDDIIPVANDFISIPVFSPGVPVTFEQRASPIPVSERRRINKEALEKITRLIEEGGVLMVQAFGMPGSITEQNKIPVSGLDSILRLVLRKNPNTNILPLAINGNLALQRRAGPAELHDRSQPVELVFGKKIVLESNPSKAAIRTQVSEAFSSLRHNK